MQKVGSKQEDEKYCGWWQCSEQNTLNAQTLVHITNTNDTPYDIHLHKHEIMGILSA